MRLLRLRLEHFACIRSLRLDLGPGLNVLYGPNDLGKSSLAAAIRAALLMPHTARAHEAFVEWQGDRPPRVELIFQTEPRRFWRVDKTFGSGRKGSSTFAASRDGETFITEAKGRQVDGEIRRLLEWGIPGPGGKGSPRKPETFLTRALLADQDEVAAVFASRLDEDPDESGKQRLTRALEAMAQDPLFRRVLQRTQARVDEAFTPRGSKKGGKGAPFPRLREELRRAEEDLERWREQRQSSDGVRSRLDELREQRLLEQAARQQAGEWLAELEVGWAQELARREAAARLAAARQELARREALLEAARETEAQQGELRGTLEAQAKSLAAASEQLSAAEQAFREASEDVRRREAEEGEQTRQLERQALEKRQLELSAAEDAARRLAEDARAAGKREAQVEQLAVELARYKADQQRVQEELAAHQETARQAREERRRLAALAQWLRRRRARGELERAAADAERARDLRRQAEEKRAAAQQIQSAVEALHLPAPETLATLQRLHGDLRVAEAQLEVGLSVAVRPLQPLAVELSRDGEEPQSHSLGTFQVTFEAQRQLRLRLAEQADVVVTGGTQEARDRAEALRTRWRKEAEPALAAAGVSSLEQLEQARRSADERLKEALEHAHASATLTTQAEALAEAAARHDELQQQLAEAGGEVAEEELEAQAAALEARQPEDLGNAQRVCEARLATAEEAIQGARVRLAGLASRLEARAEEHAAARERLAAEVGAFDAGWREAAAVAEADLEALRGQRVELEAKLAARDATPHAALDEARQRLEEAEFAKIDASTQRGLMQEAHEEATQALERLRGELKARREQAEGVDAAGARRALERVEAELAALPEPRQPVGEEEVEAARRSLAETETRLRDTESEIRGEEGALRQVAGDVARERAEGAADAVAQIREREAELERDYGAWRLLLQALRDAENEQAAHLGQALIPEVSERFGDLTGGRYGSLALGPNLETHGIVAGGARQDVGALSVGTRDKLATLLRLALARQLGSFLLLDDQLTQSDIGSMEWFREHLLEAARDTQVLVLTCRPEEYLTTAELPAAGEESVRDRADGRVRAIDLEALIERS